MNKCMSKKDHKHVPTERTLLLVTDLSSSSEATLQSVCLSAATQCEQVELIYVVDPERTSSRPDAQMGIQYRLDTMLQSLKRVHSGVRSVLLFGSPEAAIVQRANQAKAKLIALSWNPASSNQVQQGLVRRLMRRLTCPIVILPPAVT